MVGYYEYHTAYLPDDYYSQKYLHLSHISNFNKSNEKNASNLFPKKINFKKKSVQFSFAILIYFLALSLHGCG